MTIFIDADACPVKDEIYKVAARHGWPVKVVANQWIKVPMDPKIEMMVVQGSFDAADDWIIESAGPGDLVVTADILLAERAVKKQVRALNPKGHEYTAENIGEAVAMRALATHVRQTGGRGGPAAMAKADRSRFLSQIEQIIQNVKRLGV